MKIIQINSVYNQGSTGKIVADLESLISIEGELSTVAYGRGVSVIDRFRICKPYEVFLDVINNRLFDRQGFWTKKSTLKLIDYIDYYNPDIIHLHNIHGYYLHTQLLFDHLKKIKKPIVWTLHDCWPFTGHCAYFDYVHCEKWKTECHNCPQRGDYPASFLLDSSRRNYLGKKQSFNGLENLTLVTPSRWLLGLVKDSFLCEYPCRIINNGVNLEVFKLSESSLRVENDLQTSKVILGVAAPWSKRKGIDDIIQLASTLKHDHRIVLIGLSEKQKKWLPKNIVGLGRTSSSHELARWYSLADVFINPTYEDNYPTTNLEAIACGTPVVTYRTGGAPESITPSTGIVVNKFDIKGLEQAIYTITKNGKEHYKNNCISFAANNFNKNIKFKEYISLYRELCHK